MKLLLVEDDEVKGGELLEFLRGTYPGVEISLTKSFDGALRELVGRRDIDVLVLDMSLPSHDSAAGDLAGAENFAGRELLAQMKFRKITVPTVVVTMFDKFGKGGSKVSVDELRDKMARDFPGNFVGLVYYSLAQEGWRTSLKGYLDTVRGER